MQTYILEIKRRYILCRFHYFCQVIDFSSEIMYRTARSGGSGGQNVNKVETMVEALWQVGESRLYSDEEKARLLHKLDNKINKEGYLYVRSSEARTQLENKEISTDKILQLVSKALTVPKKRKVTRPSAASKEKRLEDKKREGQKKQMRRLRKNDI